MKKIMIAGTKSGVGKTTVTMGVLAALSQKLNVQAFKVGPDYIDPAYHTYITSNSCSNLDSYILGEPMINYLFNKNCLNKDIAVIEGVMGLFDGASVGSDIGTSAGIAKILDIPVILVVDGSKVASSLAATVKGFSEFDKDLKIAGVIINNVGSKAHYELLKDAINYYTDVIPCGYLIKNSDITMPERHLGLVPLGELDSFDDIFRNLGNHIKETVDLNKILEICHEFEPMNVSGFDNIFSDLSNSDKRVNIAIARDEAFNFYYQDSLDLLSDFLGVNWIEYSPIHDKALPKDIAGLYIGGGFPEVFAKEIEANSHMKNDLLKHLSKGLPYLAECGGLMYLGEELVDLDHKSFNMIGWLKGSTRMTKRLQRFGYAQLKLSQNCILGEQETTIKIHEFHRSKADMEEEKVYHLDKVRKNKVVDSWECGYSKHGGLAGYAHIHFASNLKFGKSFVDKCRTYMERS